MKIISYVVSIIIIAHSIVFLVNILSRKTDKMDTIEVYKNRKRDMQTAEPIHFDPQIKEEIKLYY